MNGRLARKLVSGILSVLCLLPSMASAQGGEKFLWTELIAFDNAAADYGVGEYLSRMAVKPAGVVVLRLSR